jgi:NAD(P)-dependent dehydrogenase (short-subunit alcohol dehydrogenase family)
MSHHAASFSLAGTTALVTGANRGIGRALVEALLARGASKIYATARRLDTLTPLVAAGRGRVVPLQLDVTRPEDVRVAAATATDVRLLINNAGVAAKFGGDLTDADWLAAGRNEFDVNVFGLLAVTQAFVPALSRRPGSAVVNVSSVAGLVNMPAIASYSASKAAAHSLTQATRALLRASGIYVAGVYPGPIDTDMSRSLPIDKTTPEVAAHAILDGLEAGQEEIFPDPFARQLGELYSRAPKTVEEQYGAPVTVA